MKLGLASTIARAVVGVALAVVACSDADPSECKVDADCVDGNVCREGSCVRRSSDGSGTTFDGGPALCAGEGATCAGPDECCSRACTSGRCGAPAAPQASTCKGVYELCQGDCCSGLRCISGTCR